MLLASINCMLSAGPRVTGTHCSAMALSALGSPLSLLPKNTLRYSDLRSAAHLHFSFLSQPISPCSFRQRDAPASQLAPLKQRRQLVRAAAGQDDLDFAVFRFTLGIPGFDDDLIPRVVGVLGAVLLTANHLAAGSAAGSAALGRAEALGVAISAVCIATPSIQQRLKQPRPVRGATKAAPAFLLASDLTSMHQVELAWASFALMRNTAATALLVVRGSQVLAARGALGSAAVGGETAQQLVALSQAVEAAQRASGSGLTQLQSAFSGTSRQLYLADPAAMRSVGADQWSFAPSDSRSALAVRIEPTNGDESGLLLLFCDQQRGLSQRQRSWAAAIASKLSSACL
mmetsp:Transcript_5952/g.17036  ORF Transcript_5952/g.17036 Transcript_5952/m.17036 type:complete len:345 (+) Transcript_5952:52-1086(+)